MKIKILLVDDHAVVLKGLSFFLCTQPDFELVGEAQNGLEALEKVAELQPDVVLMDLMMPDMDGIEATAEIKRRFPHVKVLVLSSFSDQVQVVPALRAGAAGYLLKDVRPDQLVEAIRGAWSGNIQLHPEITSKLMAQAVTIPPEGGKRPGHDPADSLTARETEVIRLLAQGMSNKEIAAVLQIAEKTVKTHVSSILGKLELADRTQAALFAVRNGFVHEES